MKKLKNIIVVVLAAIFVFGFTAGSILLPDKEISEAERRKLEKFPQITLDSVLSGKFMTKFESYTLDQFPLRDGYRGLKSFFVRNVMMQKDNNGYYEYDGYIIKSSYPYNEKSVSYATGRFELIYETYLKDTDAKVYLTIVPDKNCFVPEGYLSMDYTEFTRKVAKDMDYAEYIDIFPLLELSDYYATDTHWRQEKITDVAQLVSENMGVTLNEKYSAHKVEEPFYGVYHGQSALNDMEKLRSDNPMVIPDPYEMFLSGPNRAIVVLENPNASTDKELIIFRDSYANAIAPMFLEGYSKVTLIDMRRVMPQFLGRFVEFSNQDVLFMQSTLVLNDSSEIK